MSQKGLIIGFANQQRKRVLQGYQNQRTVFDNQYIIQKAQGFIGDRKEEIQQEIIQMISEHPMVNTIYIVLKYQRIDNMRKQLSLIMEHFQNYVDNIYLIVANFQISQDKQKDQESIRIKLVQQYNLINYFQYQFGQTFDQDSIYFDSQEIMGEDIIHYFNKTIQQEITFDGNLMNLYPKINFQLLQEIEQYINANKGTSNYPLLLNYDNKNAQQSSNESGKTLSDSTQEINVPIIGNIATIQKNELEFQNSNQQKQIPENNNDQVEIRRIENTLLSSLKNDDNKISYDQLSQKSRKEVIQIKGASGAYLGINFIKLNKPQQSLQPSFLCSSSLKCQEKKVCKTRINSSPIKQLKEQKIVPLNNQSITKTDVLENRRMIITSKSNHTNAFRSYEKEFR